MLSPTTRATARHEVGPADDAFQTCTTRSLRISTTKSSISPPSPHWLCPQAGRTWNQVRGRDLGKILAQNAH
jgi:hypothetical protein